MALSGIEVIGKIIKVSDPKSGVSKRTGNEWKSQEYVIEEVNGGYPRDCVFTVFGADRIAQFNIKVGDTVHVWLDITARPWEDRYFNDIRAFRVDHVDPNSVGQPAVPFNGAPAQQSAPQAPAADTQDPAATASEAGDELPF